MKTMHEIEKEIEVLEKELDEVKGTDTEVYTRIVGYHRAVTNWNNGKKQEYFDRVTFKVNNANLVNIIDETKCKSDDRKEAAQIQSPVSNEQIAFYKMFYSITCRNCPPVKNYLKDFPLPGEEIDVTTDLGINSAKKYNIMSTPTVIFFDENDHIISTANSIDELKSILTKEKLSVAV